jgi:hypothetical protein
LKSISLYVKVRGKLAQL